MRVMTEDDFLEWAGGMGLALDPDYPDAAVLDFLAPSDARFWLVPPEPERRPYFLGSLIDLMEDWQTCYVWRHRGPWPAPALLHPERIRDAVELRLLEGLGIPLGTEVVLAFDRGELATLVTLLFVSTV